MHVLIVLLKSSVCIPGSLLPLFCLSTQTYSLAVLNATVTCMHASSYQQSCMVIHSVCTSALQPYQGISTLVLLIYYSFFYYYNHVLHTTMITVSLAHAQVVHMLIVFCVHSLSHCSAWVHKAAAWLDWFAIVTCMQCMQSIATSSVHGGPCHHHQGINTLVLLIYYIIITKPFQESIPCSVSFTYYHDHC